MYRYKTNKSKRTSKIEVRLKQLAMRLAKMHLDNKPRTIDWRLKEEALVKDYDELHKRWKESVFIDIVGRKTLVTINKMYKRRIRKIQYYTYIEQFFDEDTGEVVGVERIRIVTIDNQLYDANERKIIFNLTGDNLSLSW